MSTFFIVPYEPTTWKTAKYDLEIDPKWYKTQLTSTWPNVQFFDSNPTIFTLVWHIITIEGNGPITNLHREQPIISMSAPFVEYILWHRTVILENHTLFLTSDISSNSIELKTSTTTENIQEYLIHC